MQAGLSGIMSDEYRAAVGERVHLSLDSLAKNGKRPAASPTAYSTRVKVPTRPASSKKFSGASPRRDHESGGLGFERTQRTVARLRLEALEQSAATAGGSSRR